MRHRKRKLLAAAVLAVAVSTQSIAQPEAVSDDALEEVSGQGLQVVENHNATFPGAGNQGLGSTKMQNNNVDSVQINDEGMIKSQLGLGAVYANSAVNTTANMLSNLGQAQTSKAEIKQSNKNFQKNHSNYAKATDIAIAGNLNKQTQLINNEIRKGDILEIVRQNNNNNSVQLNDSAQAESSGIILVNAAASAVGTGVNIFATGSLIDSSVTQYNDQIASNFDNTAEAVGGDDPTALASNAESRGTQIINNGGEILSHEDKWENVVIYNQDNNNNSLQINDKAQSNANYILLKNLAKTAANNGLNIIYADNIETSKISQANKQFASNHSNIAKAKSGKGSGTAIALNLNKERQYIDNGRYYDKGDRTEDSPKATIIDQDNNNNSVQLNHNAQNGVRGFVVENGANSAMNTGLNLAFIPGDVVDSTVTQRNIQVSNNYNNTAYGENIAGAGNVEQGATQTVDNFWTEVKDQDNNNNSVQINDAAQSNAVVGVLENVANSASNIGVNILSGSDVDPFVATNSFSTSLIQENKQTAINHRNIAISEFEEGIAVATNFNKQTQVIKNYTTDDPLAMALIEDQDNNNNSVQLNDDAQSSSASLITVNSALSGVNTGMNILNANKVSGTITQKNMQIASNFENIAQSNNIAFAGNAEITDGTFYKTGEPEAGQMIENVHVWIKEGHTQNNNNNSVQLNDNAQKGYVGLVLVNVANSALNVGSNIMNVDVLADGEVRQINKQSAGNHNNVAKAKNLALASNINKEKQYIYNCNCLAIEGEQNNNMNSVQINGNAQSDVAALILVNAANSAGNTALNLLNVNAIEGGAISQINVSSSTNFSNTAAGSTAIAGNGDFGIDIGFPF